MRMLTQRIGIFVNLPLDKLSKLSLQKRLEEIGQLRAGSPFRTTRLNRKSAPPVALTRLGGPLMSHERLLPGIFWTLS